jgi:competence protein ComEA
VLTPLDADEPRHARPWNPRAPLRALLVLAAVAAVAATALFLMARPRMVDAEGGNGTAAGRLGVPATQGASPDAVGAVVVHVVGMVRRPGVVTLLPGARVADAVRAAGGLARGVPAAAVNLARPVVDGEQLVIGPLPSPSGSGAGDAPAGRGSTGGDSRLDLNSADAAALEALDGIGPVLAQRIVDHRRANGPFRSVEGLREVSGIGPKIFAAIADRVRV